MTKSGSIVLTILAALSVPASAQVFDNTGNNLLSGNYYFREVIFNLNSGLGAAVYGTMSFSGNGGYSINALEIDTSSGTQQAVSGNGTYTISASGFGSISSQFLNTPIYGSVSNGIFVGSDTESGYNDLFIAAPIASQSTGTLQGSYTLAYIDPGGALTQVPFDAQLQMTANGGGGIGTVNVTAYLGSATPVTQSISNVKYFVSNSAFVLQFPVNSNSALIQNQEYLYSSPDGSFVFGGSPGNFDMIVGVRNGSSASNFGGLYYQAGLDEDLSQLASTGGVGLATYYGSFNAGNGAIVGHQRLQDGSAAAGNGYTYYDPYPAGTNGTYNDTYFGQNYIGGSGGAIRIGYGIYPSLAISLAVQAPSFSGNGVYLNPTGVLNAASSAPFTAGVSRGELVTLFGNNLGPSQLQIASKLPFPASLGGVQVMINNVPAPIYYVSSSQVSAIVPYETTAAVAQIQVVNNGATSNAVTELVNLTTPGIFTVPAGGLGNAAALHSADFSLVTPSNPARIGETIAVYVTGLGDVFPSVTDGSAGPTNPLSNTSNMFVADVSGTAAAVTYSGLAPGLAGLYQVNVTIPSGVTAGNNFLGISGPDSYATEATISVAGAGAAVQAAPTRPEILRSHKTPKYLPPPRR